MLLALQRGPVVRAFVAGGIVRRGLIERMGEAVAGAQAARQGEATRPSELKPDAAMVAASKRLGSAKRPGFVKGKGCKRRKMPRPNYYI
jgi:hypothetical protein